MTIFYVGTSRGTHNMLPDGINVMFNARNYYKYGKFAPKATKPKRAGKVFMDSGGFVFFSKMDEYPFKIPEYANFISRYKPDYYASMDYPCEKSIITRRNLSVEDNIKYTVENAVKLAEYEDMIPGSTMLPVIQGYKLDEYFMCMELYAEAGLIKPYMAVGSMCKRDLYYRGFRRFMNAFHEESSKHGIEKLHLFGLKANQATADMKHKIYSQDSAALFFAPNNDFKRRWNGRKFAKTMEEKYEVIDFFLNKLTNRGYQYKGE